MIFMLNKSISEKGIIKRFGYKQSNTIKDLVDSKIKKWATQISLAFKEDLITQMRADISFKDLNI
jgi:ribosomal protein S13